MEDSVQQQEWFKKATALAEAMVQDTMNILAQIQALPAGDSIRERALVAQLNRYPREPLELAVLVVTSSLSRTDVVKLNKLGLISKLLPQ